MADSEEEIEAFQITPEDFMPRKRKKFTKAHGIYGIWSRDSDDEDYGSSSKKDYTRPVSFVKKGVVGGDREQDSDEEEEVTEDLDAEAARILQERVDRKDKVVTEPPPRSTAKRGQELRTVDKLGKGKPRVSAFRSKNETVDSKFASWEKYTTGMGSKLMAMMGYKHGQGLGRHGEGIINPVKASKQTDFDRKGPHHDARSRVAATVEDEEEMEEQRQFQLQLQQWRINEPGGKKKKPQYKYRTVEELKDIGTVGAGGGGGGASEAGSVKVIDMTGPEVRVLNSYDQIHRQHAQPDAVSAVPEGSKEFLPELLHNTALLVEQTEQEILMSDRKLKHAQDMVVNLEFEKERLGRLVHEEEDQMKRLNDILRIVEICEERAGTNQDGSLSLEECEELLVSIRDQYPQEYRLYGLSSLAVAVAFPRIKTLLQNWDMLTFPTLHSKVFESWRHLLKGEEVEGDGIPGESSMSTYDRLMWEVWMLKFRATVSTWSPKNSNGMVDLMEEWAPLLPPWILENVLDQFLMPKIQAEVDSWDPTTDTVPIHSWIHPWLPILKNRLEPVYPTIRYKLANALKSWHPSDQSAHMILEPWVDVFPPGVMETFVSRTILPQLSYCLQLMVINPNNQDIQPFKWVIAWRDMVSPAQFASMLDKAFFPKWLQVLNTWLANSPNYDEVTQWYTGWKSLFDSELLAQPTVKAHFSRALDLMNHALSGRRLPGLQENMAYFTTTERRKEAELAAAMEKRRATSQASTASASLNFKDVVERTAKERGILFMPAPNQRRQDGKTVYRYGTATVYLEQGVVFVQRGSEWVPMSLSNLNEMS